ncbi:MAG: TatD family hydrolase [Sulfolobaceae archaeon]
MGIHPWRVHEENIERVLPLINNADFIGEVGLDFRFAKAPKDLQIEVFKKFILNSEDKTLNVHALDAWRETFDLLVKYNVKRAIFHWYTGPIDLLKDIEAMGYFITVNPSVTFQKKHQEVVEKADISIILTESDGGYEYRGRMLEPIHIIEALEYISKVKEIDINELNKIIKNNFNKAFNFKK